MSKMTWSPLYHERMAKECPRLFSVPENDVFAFQEMTKASSTAQNDKNIFASITSLMKAQAYEMSILENRQKDKKRLYQFNLLSVIDSEIVRIYFDGDNVVASEVDSEDYLCRYILNKEEDVARIKFVTAKALPDLIDEYSDLHKYNCEIFGEYYEKFYADAYRKWEKTKALLPEFNLAMKSHVSLSFYRHNHWDIKLEDLSITWHEADKNLSIDVDGVNVDVDVVGELNDDQVLKDKAEKVLEKVFKYKGDFFFDIGIPF